MPDVRQEIRDWLHKQQDWLQEAAERILSSGDLSDADVPSLVELLKSSEGRTVTTHRDFEHLGTDPDALGELRLVSIGEISGIENLAPRTPLSFGNGNLAVVYGPNGSGKSGYTRILKRTCGHPRASTLKSNVFAKPPPTRGCTISYRLAGKDRKVGWEADGEAIGELRPVDIFDSDSAAFYLTQETTASYAPSEVRFFGRLAGVIDRVRTKLEEEQAGLAGALPVLPSEYATTNAGAVYEALVPEATAEALTRWTEEDDEALRQLEGRLKGSDPSEEAKRTRRTKGQVEQLTTRVRSAATVFSVDGLEAVRRTRTAAHVKRQSATDAGNLSSAELDGIGTEAWKTLWEAARTFSSLPYPEREYPVIGADARCLLCQQELSGAAEQRLRDFEAFVQGQVEAEAEAAERAYRAALDNLPSVPSEQEMQTQCEAAGLDDSHREVIASFWHRVAAARSCLLRGETEVSAVPVDSPTALLDELTERARELEEIAEQRERDAEGFDREGARKDRLELTARRWTAQQAEAIRSEIARLGKVKEFEEWKGIASSRNTSLKAGEIAEKVITQAFVDRFNQELQGLGASRIRVELAKTRTERGEALHQLLLSGAESGKDVPDAVLSEGERRIVALAAFLADVAEKPHAAPFIFDDPISSLDHDFEWQVATRLARLAKDRQVLVFTHRLSLYGAMEDAARKLGEAWKKTHLEQRCIESFGGVSGQPADEAVWNANTKKANNILLERLKQARKAAESEGGAVYRIHAQAICSDFRKLLERSVEDDLLNEVVKRHRRSVTTDKRIRGLPCISEDDCRFIDELMTKYSAYEHSQSSETPSFLPEEPELREDLEALRDWREVFRGRQKTAMA